MFNELLQYATTASVTPELALRILEESRDPQNALALFQTASALRDEHIGKELWWTGAIEGILPCQLRPMCGYCTYHNFEKLTQDALVKALKSLERLGFRHLHLSGGTNLDGYDDEIVAMVGAMRAVSDIAIEVNLGPSLRRETIRRLKALGVSSITSSLETCNEELFHAAKPGDSLAARKALLEMCDEEDMPTRGMLLIGLGESYEDRIQHLFYLRGLKGLRHVRFSRFYPPPGSNYANLPRCSPWELARTIAVARLILPGLQLGLAAGNSHDDIPLWFLAGGGNQLLGAAAVRKQPTAQTGTEVIPIEDGLSVVNRMPIQKQYARDMGLSIGFTCPPGA
jgi:biotin synthase